MFRTFAHRRDVRVRAVAAAVGVLASMVAVTSHAQLLRFETTQPGNVVAIGNTLGLAKGSSENGPGTADSIGTFVSLDPTSFDSKPPNPANPWGPRTTDNWTKNGSTAKLVLPDSGVRVLYAELVWGGSYKYGGEDVTMYLDLPVVKLAYGDDAIQPKPDPGTKSTLDYFATGIATDAEYYSRSADVTDFVQAHLGGLYAVTGVPATQATGINALDAAGWALMIAYRHDGDPIRELSILVGNGDQMVDANVTVDYSVADFCAPQSGSVHGSVAVAALGGDADHGGDTLRAAADPMGSFVGLSGPNNPASNFFASQINDATGALDTSGTFGNANHDAVSGTNTYGGRQGWDVTNVGLSSDLGQLALGQRTLVVRAATTGDSFLPLVAGIAIDVNAPRFSLASSVAAVSPPFVSPGGRVMITASLANEGTATADGVRFSLDLPAGASLVSFSIDGGPADASQQATAPSALSSGIAVGSVAMGVTRTVAFELDLAVATTSSVSLKPRWSYRYVSCADLASTAETFEATTVTIPIHGEDPAPQAPPPANVGSPGADGAVAGGGSSCATSPRGSAPSPPWTFIALAAAGLAVRRRRSHALGRLDS
jgi:uncharacterized repeat protein (TIGR01451 family)/MYXO-CTERM domain-containing protein